MRIKEILMIMVALLIVTGFTVPLIAAMAEESGGGEVVGHNAPSDGAYYGYLKRVTKGEITLSIPDGGAHYAIFDRAIIAYSSVFSVYSINGEHSVSTVTWTDGALHYRYNATDYSIPVTWGYLPSTKDDADMVLKTYSDTDAILTDDSAVLLISAQPHFIYIGSGTYDSITESLYINGGQEGHGYTYTLKTADETLGDTTVHKVTKVWPSLYAVSATYVYQDGEPSTAVALTYLVPLMLVVGLVLGVIGTMARDRELI